MLNVPLRDAAVSAAALVLVLSQAGAAQSVHVAGLHESGFIMVGPGEADFASRLAALDTIPSKSDIDPIIPFSALLVNQSGRAVRAFAVKFVSLDAAGRVSESVHVYGSAVALGKDKPVLLPGAARLIAPMDIASAHQRSSIRTLAERRASMLRASSRLDIVLDSVLTETGECSAQPGSATKRQFEGDLDAAREIVTMASKLLDKGRDSENQFYAWLQSAAAFPFIPPRLRREGDWVKVSLAGFARLILAERRVGRDAAVRKIITYMAQVNAQIEKSPNPQ